MYVEGEQTIPIGVEQLWHLLMDPEFLAVVIPGCGELEQIDDHRYKGVVSARLGPIESRFKTDFTLGGADFPNRFQLCIMGQGAGGFVTSDLQFDLIGRNDDSTLLQYRGETTVGGKLAAIGQRLIEAAARSMIKKGFDDLRGHVEQGIGVKSAQGSNSESN